ncbi:SusC/RagA family TonB-linked outer membrane protein [Dysgonomonas sp. GY75]|uniref:SusC/RagA family TonB-linked outer membrane protein n=1 Tax=Dysgonomonas sp. GY75 TaxID=2780419 RepID=UPI0018840DEA|nr:SusC/RagA family TonB-linked outer membrane protein [Dysgonomonas sp. GY75]MBF0650835.1 SusC/RagA family TonB-linked outer membrane protein [Dysgonomonas sp. GY75]
MRLLTLLLLIISTITLSAQNTVLIKGKVLAEDGTPLPGASVYIDKNTIGEKTGIEGIITNYNMGTIADAEGEFTLSVPKGIIHLTCAFIGFETQQVDIRDKAVVTITMKESGNALDAVVVTGYQTIERRKLTAAITTVSISDESVGTVNSIDQALAGQVAGLSSVLTSGSPTAPVKLRIRGIASLNGTQDPLWVLDGMPLEGTDIPKLENDNDLDNIRQSSIAGLSPSDIESITILKDVAATAIYGARAANDVIVITTKRGKVGKPRVNVSTKLTYSPKRNIDRLNLMNADQKVGLELDLLRYDNYYLQKMGGVHQILQNNNLVNDYLNNGWNALPSQVQQEINNLRAINTDWNDILFRDTFDQEYNVSVSGGSENMQYYNSFSYSSQNGNVEKVSSNRFSLMSKTNYKFNNHVKTGLSIHLNRRTNSSYLSDTYGIANPLSYSRKANPYQQPYDANGNYSYDYNVQDSDRGLKFNIFEEYENTSNKTDITSSNIIWDLEFRLLNDRLKLTSQLGIQSDKTSIKQIAEEESFTMRELRQDSFKGGKSFLPDGGVIRNNENDNSQVAWKGMAEYRDTYNGIHELEVMGGSEIRKTWYTTLYSAGFGYNSSTETTQPIVFPDASSAQLSRYRQYQRIRQVNAYASFFATASYSLLQRYILGGSIRFDGSDLFGVDPKYRYLPLYSVSGSWRVMEEPFMKNQKNWLDNLAIRTSYGIQGNIDKKTSPYLLGKYEVRSLLPDGSEQIISIASAPNDKLRWEKTKSVNLGVDISVLKQRVNLSVDYYYRKGTDLIGFQMLPLETGFYSTNINWASMTNKGIEIALRTENITTKDFSWYTNLNFAYNKNKVLKEKVGDQNVLPSREGYPAGAIFALKTDGLDEDGLPLFVDKQGNKVTLEELYKLQDVWGIGLASSDVTPLEERGFYSYMGTKDAPYTGGILNTFSYKNWELSCNIAYYLGAHVQIRPPYSNNSTHIGQNTDTSILDRWTPENPDGKFPAIWDGVTRSLEYNWYNSREDIYRSLDIWVKKQNYFRLQNVRLAYNIPQALTRKLTINNATVALEARNLLVWGTSYKNYLDPETMGNKFATPIPRSFVFSLNFNF